MLYYGQEWSVLDSYFQFREITTPVTPQATEIRLYAKASGGVSTLCYLNDAGTEICLPTVGPIVSGSGTANHLAMWSSASVLTDFNPTAGSVIFAGVGGIAQQDNAHFFWDDPNNRLGIGTATPTAPLDVLVSGTTDPAIQARSVGSDAITIRIQNSVGRIRSWIAGTTNDFLTGTAAGDSGINWTTAKRFWLGLDDNTPRFLIGASGELGIGGATFGAANSIFTSNGAGAAPSWNTTLVVTTVTASGLTPGSVVFAGTAGILSQDNANFFWEDTNNTLLVGSNVAKSTVTKLETVTTSSSDHRGVSFQQYSADSGASQLSLVKGRGTFATPVTLNADDAIGKIFFRGWGSSTVLQFSASITGFAAENFTATAAGTYITFNTTPLLSITPAERFRVGPAGQWGIGGATFGGSGDIFSSGGASAAPTWVTRATLNAALDHNVLTNLTVGDVHTQYALLAGRSGGQTLIGGTAASNPLILQSTSNATRGSVKISDIVVSTTERSLLIGATHTAAAFGGASLQALQENGGTISTVTSGAFGLYLSPLFSGSGNNPGGVYVEPIFQPSASINNVRGLFVFPDGNPGAGVTITNLISMEFGVLTGSTGGAVTNAFSLRLDPPVIGTVIPTNIYGCHISNQGVASVTNAVALKILAQSGATNNFGIQCDSIVDLSGISAGNPNLQITATSDTPSTVWTAGVPSNNPAGYMEIVVGGNPRYIPFWT